MRRLQAFEDGLRLKHHPFSAAKRTIIHRTVAVVRERPQVVYRNLNETGLARPAHNAVIQRPAKKVRKNRQDLELHSGLPKSHWAKGNYSQSALKEHGFSRAVPSIKE